MASIGLGIYTRKPNCFIPLICAISERQKLQPFIMLEICEISSLVFFLGYGGSGDGDESLTMGFRGLLQVKKVGKRGVQVWAGRGNRCVQCFKSWVQEEISSGSTTTRSDISLPDYEAFYDDHVKEISSPSTTTHSNCLLYDFFIFDLLINPFPPADRSDFFEFSNELAHIISPPKYDCFCFKNEPNSGDFTMNVVEDIFPTREPRVSKSLFAYVVWIFLSFLSYSVAPQYLLSFGNEDTIFDPGISSYHIYSFMPDISHRSETFMKFNVYPKHLNGSLMEISFSTCSPMDQ
nr:hypothetical protein [Tanacetum cinerariifolium]